jgi:L-aminopeptidase/D-esterase-like protein
VGALVVVNPMGDVVGPDGAVVAGPGSAARLLAEGLSAPPPIGGTHTTLAVVCTDLALTKADARRLAVVGHDGLARAIRPVHRAYDGDTVFAAGTGALPATPEELVVLQTAAAEVVADAVRAAVG